MPGFNILCEEPSNAIWQTFLGRPRRQGDKFISVSIEVGLAQVSKSRHFDLDIPRARPGPVGNFLWQWWPCLLLLMWYNTESSLGRRGFTWLTDPSTGKVSEDSRAGTEGRPQRAAASWVVSESLSYTSSQDLHWVIPSQQAGKRLYLSTIKKTAHMSAWWRRFCNWDSFFPGKCSFVSRWQKLTHK